MIAATNAITWKVATTPGASVEWGTPPALYLALDQEFRFTIDVASSGMNAKHVRHLTKADDALAVSWAGERVFCNPPYGRFIGRWTAKALVEARERGTLVVLLVPSRTDVKWFHDDVLPYAEIRFIRGRLGFTRDGKANKARAPFASMVAIFRPGLPDPGTSGQLLFPFLQKVVTP